MGPKQCGCWGHPEKEISYSSRYCLSCPPLHRYACCPLFQDTCQVSVPSDIYIKVNIGFWILPLYDLLCASQGIHEIFIQFQVYQYLSVDFRTFRKLYWYHHLGSYVSVQDNVLSSLYLYSFWVNSCFDILEGWVETFQPFMINSVSEEEKT